MATSKKSKSRKPGQPTKYKKEYCEKLIESGRLGKSFRWFCASIGVHWDTGYEWMKHHPDFSDAKKEAKSLSNGWWEDVAQAATLGKIKGFQMGAFAMYMKNVHGWGDDPQNTEDEETELEFL